MKTTSCHMKLETFLRLFYIKCNANKQNDAQTNGLFIPRAKLIFVKLKNNNKKNSQQIKNKLFLYSCTEFVYQLYNQLYNLLHYA